MIVCDGLTQRALIDSCLNQVSGASASKLPCSSIVDSDLKDACLIPFAYTNDFSVCAEISNPYMKNSCNSLSELSKYSVPEQ